MTDATPAPEPDLTDTELSDDEVFEQKAVRLEKRLRLIESGDEAYPVGVPITTTIPAVRARLRATSRPTPPRATSSAWPAASCTSASAASSASQPCSRATARASR